MTLVKQGSFFNDLNVIYDYKSSRHPVGASRPKNLYAIDYSAIASVLRPFENFAEICYINPLLLYLKNKHLFCYNINNGCPSYNSLAYSLDIFQK